MSETQNVDLSNCEKEPIHLVNAIQDVGYFVRLRYYDLEVIGCSENLIIEGALPSLESLFNNDNDFRDWMRNSNSDEGFVRIPCKAINGDAALRKSILEEKEIHLEFETYPEVATVVGPDALRVQIDKKSSLESLGQYLVEVVHKVTGYDRVMLYRFDEEYNGHVVNQQLTANSPLVSYLGHRFPASDIPRQAREMLVEKRTRMIADVDGGSFVIHQKDPKLAMDMTYSEYRYPSEIHLEYLRNMKVRSTFTISLLYQGALWGLIACHHPTQLQVSPMGRNLCDDLAKAGSEKIKMLVDHQSDQDRRALSKIIMKLGHNGDQDERKLDKQACQVIADFFRADRYFYYQNQSLVDHSDLEVELRDDFHQWVQMQTDTNIFSSNSAYLYVTEEVLPDRAGVLVIPLGPKQKLVLCRSVYPEVMKWAGNPDKAVEGLDAQGRISPRKSFETWVSSQNKLSESWENHLIETAKFLMQTSV